jgi:hypothetical protein
MKILSIAVAFLMLLGCRASYAKPAAKVVDFDRLLEAPESFYGKLVRVRGFLFVSLPPRDVGVIALCANENEARNFSTSHRCVLVSFSSSQIEKVRKIKSGSVEITARFTFVPALGGGRIQGLEQNQHRYTPDSVEAGYWNSLAK